MKLKSIITTFMIIAVSVAMSALLSAIPQGSSYADESEPADIDGRTYVSPSVTRFDEPLKPGESYTQTMTIYNRGDDDRGVKITVEPMGITGGTQHTTSWGVSPTQYNKITEWTTLSIDEGEEYWIEPGEKMSFDFTIDVPEDAAGGSQYESIVIHFVKVVDTGTWGVETVLNAVVYANIDGDINTGAEVTSQDIEKFSTIPRISTSSTVENTGNTDVLAKYKLEVSNPWGKTLRTDEMEYVVVPENSRFVVHEWSEAPALGIFKVATTVTLPDGDHVKEATVLIIPIWLIVLLTAFILTVIASIVVGHKKRQSSKVR